MSSQIQLGFLEGFVSKYVLNINSIPHFQWHFDTPIATYTFMITFRTLHLLTFFQFQDSFFNLCK